VGRFTRWPEAFPITDITADSATCAALRLHIPLRLPADNNYWPRTTVRVPTLSLPGLDMWHPPLPYKPPPSRRQWARGTFSLQNESRHYVPCGRGMDRGSRASSRHTHSLGFGDICSPARLCRATSCSQRAPGISHPCVRANALHRAVPPPREPASTGPGCAPFIPCHSHPQ
jgi:hypothetical protein